MVNDLLAETRRRLAQLAPENAQAVRCAPQPVVALSPKFTEANRVIKEFLFARMYRHWRVNRMSAKARVLTGELFRILHADPSLLPDGWRTRAGEATSLRAAGTVCDYIAGMTDRYAMDEHRRLTDLSIPG